jgi:hypothetical protein
MRRKRGKRISPYLCFLRFFAAIALSGSLQSSGEFSRRCFASGLRLQAAKFAQQPAYFHGLHQPRAASGDIQRFAA